MENKLIHFLYCPVTGLGLHGGYRGDKWLINRIRVFKQFVVPSLVNQTEKNFILWLSFRPEEETNPIVQDLIQTLGSIRNLAVAVTYNGVMFWDDKFENDNLLQRLKDTLPQLEPLVKDSEYVLMTIQPSDDMYIGSMVAEVQGLPFKEGQSAGYRQGYIMNYATKEIAEYNPTTTPPFFTIYFPTDVFLDPEKHFNYTGPYKSHEYIVDHTNYVPLQGRGFVVGTHGENISTTFNHPYKGRTLINDEKDAILLNVNAYFSDPVVVKKGSRLIARQILNSLPFQNTIRDYYYKLPQCLRLL